MIHGWIAVSRAIFEHDFFAPEPLTEREAWVWICAKAAWKDTRHKVGATMYEVPRGSFVTTLRGLALAWRWRSDFRVRAFLDGLESAGMVQRTKLGIGRAQKTHISVCNYEKYQNIERTNNAQTTHNGTHKKRTKEQENNSDYVGRAENDPSKVVFGQCLEWLKSAGIQENRARPILGKWRKAHGDAAIIAACGKGQREGALDPVAYVEGVFRHESKSKQDAFGEGEIVQ